jgi:hypothetical protein
MSITVQEYVNSDTTGLAEQVGLRWGRQLLDMRVSQYPASQPANQRRLPAHV